MSLQTVTIGSDPEIFLRKGGAFLSAFGLFKGTKTEPEKLLKGAVQVDGMALEFNTDPARTAEEFCDNISTVLQQIRERIDPSIEFMRECSVHFDSEFLYSQPLEARAMGCDPDYNAYEMQENERPNEDTPMRTAGGHVHIGWGNDMEGHAMQALTVALTCDLLMGVPSVLLDLDKERRALYGGAGAFRIKGYGMEYRTLSNFWVSSREYQEFIFQQAKLSFELHEQYDELLAKAGVSKEEVRRIIDTSDVQEAQQVVQALNITMPEV